MFHQSYYNSVSVHTIKITGGERLKTASTPPDYIYLTADSLEFREEFSGHLIVSNPPYYRLTSGRLNPNDQRAIARHELCLDLEQLLAATRRLLRTGGRLVCVYASERLTDLLAGMRRARIEPKRLRMVHSRSDDEARLCIVEGVQLGRPGLKVASPLVIYTEEGTYTATVQRYFTT